MINRMNRKLDNNLFSDKKSPLKYNLSKPKALLSPKYPTIFTKSIMIYQFLTHSSVEDRQLLEEKENPHLLET